MKFIGYHRFITVGCELALLVLFLWLNQTWQHPVQSSKSCSSNVSCAPTTTSFTVNEDNVTLHVDTDPSGPLNNTESPLINSSGLAQFNDRRRDIFLEDYANSIKQIEIVDTKQNISDVDTTICANSTLVSTSSLSSVLEVDQSANSTILQPQRSNILVPKVELSGTPACVESPDDTFCEVVDNYPKAAIKNEISFSPEEFVEIFGSKEIDGRKSYADDDMNEEGICRKVPRVIYPQMAKNQANQWVYVVNEVEYTQAVVAEVCEKPGKACAYLDDNLPPGMYSRCKQKYSYKRLLALHPTEKRTYPDAFKFPSCCSCYVKFDDFVGRSKGFRKIDSRPNVLDAISSTNQLNGTAVATNTTGNSTTTTSTPPPPTTNTTTSLLPIQGNNNQTTQEFSTL